MKRVGFIGLGLMGAPMAANVARAGFPLTVYNRSPEKAGTLRDLGARVAESPRELATQSEVVITMLSDAAAVEQTLHGEEGLLAGGRPGTVLIDMSTISPAVSKRIASEVAKKGCKMLDAPVGGTVSVAANAALTIQVGGDRQVFDEHRDIFSALGKNIYHIGGNGMGCYMKLVANAIMGTNMAVLAEAMCLGARAGIPTDLMLEVLKNSASSSRVLEVRGPNIVKGEYKAQFMLKLLFKDLGIILDTAAGDSIPLPIVGLARQIYGQALVDGRGDEDYSAIAATAEKLSGVKFKR